MYQKQKKVLDNRILQINLERRQQTGRAAILCSASTQRWESRRPAAAMGGAK
jgi:hypothetical protein